MKKILILLLLTLFSFVLVAQERELSDYEKYRMEKEKELYETDEEVFYIVEDMPKFRGEDAKEFRYWIAQNVRYPKEAAEAGISGKVIVSFIVDKTGKVSYAKIEKGVDKHLDAEALRVVTASPKWTAGKQRGEAVKVQFTFPINFVLDTPEEEVSEPVVINNYYDGYSQPNLRFNLTFGYGYGYHYPYYSHYYDPWYYGYGYPSYGAWYGGYYNHYAYYGMYYPYYGYNYWYGHNYYYNYGYYSQPRGHRYATRSTLGWNQTYYRPYNKTYRSGYVPAPTASKKNTAVRQPVRTQTTRYTKNGTAANTKNATYTPRYNKPRTATKQSYNRSTQPRTQKSTTVRTTKSTYNRSAQPTRSSSSYQRPTQSRSSATYSRPSTSTRSRSYSSPSYSRSSAPSRSSSSYRSSGASSSGRSYSSGSASRSSSGGSRSGGKK